MDQLYMLRAFVAAARFQSFSKAAESLNVSTGSVSKAIAKLEACMQTRVLLRTTRSVFLTDAARPYFVTCSRLLEELDEANRRVSQEREFDGGSLRLVIHPTLMNVEFARLLRHYRRIAPHIRLTISVEDGPVNLYGGRFDLAMLPSHLVEQSTVIRRTLLSSPWILVASPAYVAEYGLPQRAADLAAHFLLVHHGAKAKSPQVVELYEEGRKVAVAPISSMEGDEVLLRAAAVSGMGIAILPETMVREDIDTGHLVQLLPECTGSNGSVEICLFYPHREMLPARLRNFVDCCIDFFRTASDSADEAQCLEQVR